MYYIKNVLLVIITAIVWMPCSAQEQQLDSADFIIIPAGAEYKKSKSYQLLWGKNRRKEWTTPIRVPIVNLDTLYGGLRPYQQGGGNETKSLRLKNAAGKEFTLRSINKSRRDVIDPGFKGTFIADIIQDGVSMSYPYAAFAVPVMQQYAGIPHANPVLVYIKPQPALDTFRQKFGNDLYLFEQRPDGNWSDSKNMGSFKKFSSTEKVIDKLLADHGNSADQYAFVKVRLFDMLINDWDRHEDNWRWGVADSAGKSFYTPVPRDRDQAFFTKNGIVIRRIMSLNDLKFMQNFTHRVKNIHLLNLEQRNMDRFFTSRMTLSDWTRAAKELQQSLTDPVIDQSVKGVPAEIYKISGTELIAKLRSRRDQLETFAAKYYQFVAKEVDIPGTKQQDYFEVKRLESGETSIDIFSADKQHGKSSTPYYSRTFSSTETNEIRLYGVNGDDHYDIFGQSDEIKLRIIGGPGYDSLVQHSDKHIHIYDNHSNTFNTTSAKLHLSEDTSIHRYRYEGYNYNTTHLIPYILFNNIDGWYVGINYTSLRHKWRRSPYASSRTIGLNYYGATRAISASVAVTYPRAVGTWDLTLSGAYDALKWTNFFGTGNETTLGSLNRSYYRMRSKDWNARVGISKHIGQSSVALSALYKRVKILNDTSKYIAKVLQGADEFNPNHYAGVQLTYSYLSVNDSIVPTKGFSFITNASAYRNFTLNDIFQNYSAKLQAYLPLGPKFSLAIRGGGETIIGNKSVINNAQFLQHSIIGGPVNIRGYKAERFWGKSSFYNQNELRFITNIKSRLMNAKAGLLVFFDDGRVWLPGEQSNTLHTSYGGGVMLAPFHKISASLTYGISNETSLLQLGISTLF
jgi:hypothetical protein